MFLPRFRNYKGKLILNSTTTKQDITPTVLDSGNEIILENCPNDKQIICNINNVIPIRIPRPSICTCKQKCIV